MSHAFAELLVHVVFSTKDRRPVIREEFRPRLYEYLAGLARQDLGSAIRIGGTENHLHALLSLRRDVAVSAAVQKIKSVSTGWVRDNLAADFGWQNGYGAFTVSHSGLASVVSYLERQAAHHKRMSFEEEFVALLDRHGISYDPQHLWD